MIHFSKTSLIFLILVLEFGLAGCGPGATDSSGTVSNLTPSNCTQNNSCSASLNWGASTSPGVGGYVIDWGMLSGVYVNSQDAGTATSATISGLGAGTYYFAVAAYSGSVTFGWTPTAGAAGYTVYWGTASGVYPHSLDIGYLPDLAQGMGCSNGVDTPSLGACGIASQTIYTLNGLGCSGTYYFNTTPYTIVNGSEVQGVYNGEFSAVPKCSQGAYSNEIVVSFTSAGVQTRRMKK